MDLNKQSTVLSNLFKTVLMAFILSYKKNFSSRPNPFRFPIFKTNLSKFSFSSISIKILNLFLFNLKKTLSEIKILY